MLLTIWKKCKSFQLKTYTSKRFQGNNHKKGPTNCRAFNYNKSLVSRLNYKTFFEKFDNHLFAAFFVA
jgi:hypothetical protein